MQDEFTLGDVIRKQRTRRKWNQERLGIEAVKCPLGDDRKAINKSTVSKIENDPYGSKFGTVWRLLAALDLTLSEAERRIGPLRKQEVEAKRRTVSAVGGR